MRSTLETTSRVFTGCPGPRPIVPLPIVRLPIVRLPIVRLPIVQLSWALLLLWTVAGCSSIRLASVDRPQETPTKKAAEKAAGKSIPGGPRPILITHVAVFDGTQLLPDQDVSLAGDRIVALTPAGTAPPDPQALQIDGTGRTLLPGLIDAHVHLTSAGGAPWHFQLPDPQAYARALLYAGVTTVLVAASGPDEAKLAAAGEAGKKLAPHMYLAGPGLTAPGGHPIPLLQMLSPWPISKLVSKVIPTAASPEEARQQVDKVARDMHPPFFKIFYDQIPAGSPKLGRETLEAAVAEAKLRGMRPVAHVGTASDMVEATQAGVALLMHCAYLDQLSEAQVQQLATFKTPYVTTMGAFWAAREKVAGHYTPFDQEIMTRSELEELHNRPSSYKTNWLDGIVEQFPAYKANIDHNIMALRAAGVPFLVGTDTGVPGVFPGAGLHNELAALVKLGIPPLEVLQAATSRPAAFLDPTGSFGRVAPGMRADLLLVRGDPTTDISALDAIDAVFLNGVRLSRHLP